MPIVPFFLSIAFLALSAQLTLTLPQNLGGIPITGQSLAVLLVGFLMPRPWGVAAVVAYILLGALGLPLFADGASGWAVLAGGSGGFLAGFVLAALLMEALGVAGWPRHWGKSLLAHLLGTAVILTVGLLRLAMLYGWAKAFDYGFFPFWEGALIKVALGGTIAWGICQLRRG